MLSLITENIIKIFAATESRLIRDTTETTVAVVRLTARPTSAPFVQYRRQLSDGGWSQAAWVGGMNRSVLAAPT